MNPIKYTGDHKTQLALFPWLRIWHSGHRKATCHARRATILRWLSQVFTSLRADIVFMSWRHYDIWVYIYIYIIYIYEYCCTLFFVFTLWTPWALLQWYRGNRETDRVPVKHLRQQQDRQIREMGCTTKPIFSFTPCSLSWTILVFLKVCVGFYWSFLLLLKMIRISPA